MGAMPTSLPIPLLAHEVIGGFFRQHLITGREKRLVEVLDH